MKNFIVTYSIIVLVLSIFGCAGSIVGGERNYGERGVMIDRNDQCKGACLQYSSEGKCVSFAKGISEVCLDYFNNIER